ncbi:30S ribosomal S17P protein [Fusarium subglutinans]|uniref:30S ribosomal S17P protein n=1 Tax=Gibberella subglutinans TaxID=42677 RepID=A0A8H5P5P3_GIBSU|nr:30S ribosomal S17P protein [Fusarium subglutinans]KAF5591009.1 30S ribosomal S17P protein [Fusarium subglutinans]
MADESAESLTLEELEVAIVNLRNSLETMLQDDPNFYSHTTLLAHALRKYYLLLRPHGHLSTLEESITLLQQAVESSSADDVKRAEYLISLAFCLSLRCDATESEFDAVEASRLAYEAMNGVEKDDPSYATILQSACHFISKKAIRLHDEDDLGNVFNMHKYILSVTNIDHPELKSRFRNYDNTLFKGYLAFGHVEYLQAAIRVSEDIINIPDQSSEEHARNVWILGQRLVQRYLRTGTSADLDDSIRACQQAVDDTPLNSKDRQRRLQSLCDRLGEKYSLTREEDDYQAAKVVVDQILDHLPTKHKSRARCLGNIGIILSLRYRQTGRDDDFQRAIRVAKEAVDLTADGDIGRAVRLSNLGVVYAEAYDKTGNTEQLEEAIRIGRETLTATPNDHPDKALRHFNLADRLQLRYCESESTDDLKEAISLYRLTLREFRAPMFLRVEAGYSLMQACVWNRDLNEAYKAGAETIDHLLLFRSFSLQNTDIQREASKLLGLGTETASLALTVGRSAETALEFLEMARGVMASSINMLRADISGLEAKFPELSARYNRLRDQLDTGSVPESDFALGEEVWGNGMSHRYDTGEQISALLKEIRAKPGFKFFLRPDDVEGMKRAADLGPVIVVNVGSLLCDAIIIQRDGFSAVHLPSLSKSDIDSKYQSLGQGSLRVLEWLWDVVAEPILNALGFTGAPREGEMRRVWWILTGSLSTFPIHAAGRNTQRNGDTVMDRVMSSYATSVSAIVQSRRTAPASHDEALLVSASETPGHRTLAFAGEEISVLRDICHRMNLKPVESEPIREDVTSHLRKCKIFHFAGHGYTDTADPSKSQLYLRDWETNPLTVASLLELNLHREGPFLAYLSACGTGQIKSQTLFDEGIHIISACQLAGFRHVIGTLWEVNDQSCVDMAGIIYEEMLKGDMSDESVCRGVHVATKGKRDQWLDETYGTEDGPRKEKEKRDPDVERDIISLDEEDGQGIPGPPLHWIPYVHFGA